MNKEISMLVITLLLSHSLTNGQQRQDSNYIGFQRGPDLVPLLRHPMTRELRVKNIGTGSARRSKLTLDCEKMGAPSTMHSCPNLPLTAMGTYFDPTFPNQATIQVPELAPGATFTHKLTFWDVSKWPSGTYRFTAVADANHALAESNMKNNVATSILTIP